MSDPVEAVRRATTLTLGHLLDQEVVALLNEDLASDPDWQVRRNAAQSLALHAPSDAVPVLGAALGDEIGKSASLPLRLCNKWLMIR